MFQIGPKYVTLKTSLQIASNRLKILQAKKSEQVQKLKREIANYIKNGKYMHARIKAEKIIRDEASVEGMELVEMFFSQLLERYELFKQMKEPDDSLTIPISSLIWIVPYYQTQIGEMKTILKQFVAKYGNKFCRTALKNKNGNVCSELIERVRVTRPSEDKIENYLKNICIECGVTYREKEDRLLKGNSLDIQKICDEKSEMVNGASEAINKVKQQDTQTEFHGEGTSNTCVFGKPMRIFKFHKASRKHKVKSDKDNLSRGVVPNNEVSVPPPCDNTDAYRQLNKSILSSIEKLHEPADRSDENLVHQNLKFEETEKRNFDTHNSHFLPKSQIYDNSFTPLHQEPPPPYSIYDANQTDTNNGMLEYFKDYQLPTCPSENPDSELPSENPHSNLPSENPNSDLSSENPKSDLSSESNKLERKD